MKNSKIMDSEHYRIEEKTEEDSYDNVSNTGDIFQPAWLRCALRARDEMDRLILGNRHNFLFHLNPILYLILLFFKR